MGYQTASFCFAGIAAGAILLSYWLEFQLHKSRKLAHARKMQAHFAMRVNYDSRLHIADFNFPEVPRCAR